MHLDAERTRVAVDADALAAKDAPDPCARGQPDHAVAAERPLGDDLGHRLAGDREPAALQVQEEVIRHGLRIRPETGPRRLLRLTTSQALCEARPAVLVPGDDPPFVIMRLRGAPGEFPLRQRQGNDLVRRLEAQPGGQAELVGRILAARAGAYPQEFVAEPADEEPLLAALEAPPELAPGRLADLRDALRPNGR